jgi:hypothetical protein
MVLAAVAVFLFGLLRWESVAMAWSAVVLVEVIMPLRPPGQICRTG